MLFWRRRRTRTGVARRVCLLEKARGQGLEPLGLVGWEARRGEDGGAGVPRRPPLEALCFREEQRPAPHAPIAALAAGRGPGVRLLSLCTPSEVAVVGERLAAERGPVQPCAPAAMADLLGGYLEQAEAVDDEQAPLLPWTVPWPGAAVLEGRRARPRPPAAVPLVPIGLLFDPPGQPLEALAELLGDTGLWRQALGEVPYPVLPGRATPLLLNLLLPLGPRWREVLHQLRDEVGLLLGTEPGWFPVLPEDLLALCRQLGPLLASAGAQTSGC